MIPNVFKKTIKHIGEYGNHLTIQRLKLSGEYDDIMAEDEHQHPDVKEYLDNPKADEPNYLDFMSEEEEFEYNISKTFLKEYKALLKSKTYFIGCSFELYESKYSSRLTYFKKLYKDAQEHNFILDELQELISVNLTNYVVINLAKSIKYSLERTKEFLIKKLESLGFKVSFSISKEGIEKLSITTSQKDLSIKRIDNSLLKWNKSKTDLVELAKALIESKSVVIEFSQTEFIKQFSSFFDEPIKDPHQTLTKISKRTKDPLVLIPQLESSMQKWIEDRLQDTDKI